MLAIVLYQNSSLHTRTFISSHFDRKKLQADLFIGDIDASDGVIFCSGFHEFLCRLCFIHFGNLSYGFFAYFVT